MRMLLKATIPVEAGNAAVVNGTLGTTIQKILAELKPTEVGLIQRFIAAADCDDTERRDLSGILMNNPELIWWVAHQINENFESAHRSWLPSGTWGR